MILSSTSLFFPSISVLRLDISAKDVSSLASNVRFVSSIFSNPSMSSFRALMLSATAPSAFASFLRRPFRRAACTGGDGAAILGSVSFS